MLWLIGIGVVAGVAGVGGAAAAVIYATSNKMDQKKGGAAAKETGAVAAVRLTIGAERVRPPPASMPSAGPRTTAPARPERASESFRSLLNPSPPPHTADTCM